MTPQPPLLHYQRVHPSQLRNAGSHDRLFRAALLLITGFLSFWLFLVLNIPLYRQVFSTKWERTLGVALVLVGIASLIYGASISAKKRWFLSAFLFGGGFATAIHGVFLFMASYVTWT